MPKARSRSLTIDRKRSQVIYACKYMWAISGQITNGSVKLYTTLSPISLLIGIWVIHGADFVFRTCKVVTLRNSQI